MKGSVQFELEDEPFGSPSEMDPNGETSATIPGLADGTHQIVARYLGDGEFDASASNATELVVGPRAVRAGPMGL